MTGFSVSLPPQRKGELQDWIHLLGAQAWFWDNQNLHVERRFYEIPNVTDMFSCILRNPIAFIISFLISCLSFFTRLSSKHKDMYIIHLFRIVSQHSWFRCVYLISSLRATLLAPKRISPESPAKETRYPSANFKSEVPFPLADHWIGSKMIRNKSQWSTSIRVLKLLLPIVALPP